MLEMEAENVSVTAAGNIEMYSIKACLDLFRQLQNYSSDYLSLPENKSIIAQLESRIKTLVLNK